MLGEGEGEGSWYLDRGKKELGDEPDPKWQPGRRLRSLQHGGAPWWPEEDPWGCLKGGGWKDVPGGG